MPQDNHRDRESLESRIALIDDRIAAYNQYGADPTRLVEMKAACEKQVELIAANQDQREE
jgi:hypothetical protein